MTGPFPSKFSEGAFSPSESGLFSHLLLFSYKSFCGHMYPFFFGINLCVKLLGPSVDICLTLLHISKQFSKVAITFYTPPAKYESSSRSLSSSTLDIVVFSNSGHSSGCIVITHGINLHFPSE